MTHRKPFGKKQKTELLQALETDPSKVYRNGPLDMLQDTLINDKIRLTVLERWRKIISQGPITEKEENTLADIDATQRIIATRKKKPVPENIPQVE